MWIYRAESVLNIADAFIRTDVNAHDECFCTSYHFGKQHALKKEQGSSDLCQKGRKQQKRNVF